MVVTTWCCIASIAPVRQNVALQMVALKTLCLQVQNSLAVAAVSVRSIIDAHHLSSLKHELVALVKASLNPILIEVIRHVALIIQIVDLV